MEIVITTPSETETPRYSPKYLAVKSYYLELEIRGVVSLQGLQAGLLIALYEFGHGIYPSAVNSIGNCARYGRILGINWASKLNSKKFFAWVDVEERNRVWWAIYMLDRFVLHSVLTLSHASDKGIDIFAGLQE